MTLSEYIHLHFPLHAQRIKEHTSAWYGAEVCDKMWQGPALRLDSLFAFFHTEEGHCYWWNLCFRAPSPYTEEPSQ